MINRFFAIFVIFSAFAGGGAEAMAQDCRIEYEARVALRKPEYGASNLWDAIYGEPDRDEVFRDGLMGEDGQRLTVVGEVRSEGAQNLLFVQVGRNGRVLLHQVHQIAGLMNVVRILPHEKGFAVFANQKDDLDRPVVWMGVFDLRGFMLAQTQIADDRAGLQVEDVEIGPEGSAYLMAASASADSGGSAPSAILYRLDAEGYVLSQRAFVTGGENRISKLAVLTDGGALATGFSRDGNGRKNGWIVRLDDETGIVWQQVYPRGAAAELVSGEVMPGNLLAVVGTAEPLGGERKAGWVMTVDADNGAVGWQRFFSGGPDFYGRDVQISPDGVISAILDGDAASGPDDAPHVRIVTFSLRGEMFSADAFYNGEAVDVFGFASGASSERIMVGSSVVAHQPEKQEAADKKGAARAEESRSYQGWVLAVPSVDPYKDPCAPARPETSVKR